MVFYITLAIIVYECTSIFFFLIWGQPTHYFLHLPKLVFALDKVQIAWHCADASTHKPWIGDRPIYFYIFLKNYF